MRMFLKMPKFKHTIFICVLFFISHVRAGEYSFALWHASYVNVNYKNKFSVLDPQNRTIGEGDRAFSHYLDFSTEKYGFHGLTFKIDTKVHYDKQKSNYSNWKIKELFFSLDAGNWGTIIAGRVITDWGKCYYKKPASILDPQAQATDISNVQNTYTGIDQIRWELYPGRFSLDLVATNSLDDYHVNKWNFITRIGSYWKFLELNLITAYFHDMKTRLGFSFTSVFGNYVEFHGEYLYSQRVNKKTYSEINGAKISTEVNHAISLGFMITPGWFNQDIRFIMEYSFNSLGYTSREWSSYTKFLTNQYNQMFDLSNPNAHAASLLYQQTLSDFQIERIIRNIFFATIDNLPPLFHISLQPVLLYSPQDNGFIGIVNFTAALHKFLTAYCYVNFYGGKRGSIYQSIPYKQSLLLGISLHYTRY